ncbi:hypothetical protein BC828DRAFT_380792 [Blastocladiella britannica]|nr:hypothetical protein BC828DRAFT_380792 [Blastocladiella britannica]
MSSPPPSSSARVLRPRPSRAATSLTDYFTAIKPSRRRTNAKATLSSSSTASATTLTSAPGSDDADVATGKPLSPPPSSPPVIANHHHEEGNPDPAMDDVSGEARSMVPVAGTPPTATAKRNGKRAPYGGRAASSSSSSFSTPPSVASTASSASAGGGGGPAAIRGFPPAAFVTPTASPAGSPARMAAAAAARARGRSQTPAAPRKPTVLALSPEMASLRSKADGEDDDDISAARPGMMMIGSRHSTPDSPTAAYSRGAAVLAHASWATAAAAEIATTSSSNSRTSSALPSRRSDRKRAHSPAAVSGDDDVGSVVATTKRARVASGRSSKVSSSSTKGEELAMAARMAGAIALIQERIPHTEELRTALRLFDLDMKYGPAVGQTRAQRWSRAVSRGIAPPESLASVIPAALRVVVAAKSTTNPPIEECVHALATEVVGGSVFDEYAAIL